MTFVSTTTAAAASSVRGGILEFGEAEFIIGYGTSASAPFVSGIAALMLSQNPGLSAAQLRSRIEQFATRPAGSSRSDSFGWGIVNAYNSLTQTTGPVRQASARLVDATTGAVARTTTVNADGSFAFAKLTSGSTYYLQAGEDEAGDGLIGVPGRRFTVAGGLGNATVFNVGDDAKSVALALGLPFESEPNDDAAHANLLTVGSYVVGTITTPDVSDIYRVPIATPGTYTFETSGLVGSCGLGIELDTFLSVTSATRARRHERQHQRAAESLLLARAGAAHAGDLLRHRQRKLGQLPVHHAARALSPPGSRRQLAAARRERTNGGRETRGRRFNIRPLDSSSDISRASPGPRPTTASGSAA